MAFHNNADFLSRNRQKAIEESIDSRMSQWLEPKRKENNTPNLSKKEMRDEDS